tara:strand:+ start:3284 stop:4153 length:870 start_codon:yes stop_codon:yes gene_type:complete
MNSKQLVYLLKFCAFCIFAGRAYQHLFWDSPFRSLLWDQNMISGIVENIFNIPWNEYVTSLKTDSFIQNTIRLNGAFYAICAVISLVIKQKSNKYLKTILGLGGFSLLLLAILLSKSKFFHLAMFFEHAIQFGTPFVLLYLLKTKGDFSKITFSLKIITALTFASHGMYALGLYYPLPGNFVTMTLNILPITEDITKQFLFTAGILDFIVVVFIFIPKLQKIGLIYAVIWGVGTAFARIASGLSYDVSFSIIHQYLYTTIYRIPHGLIPLLIYFIIINRSKTNKFSEVL